MPIGELFLSAFLQVLFQRLMSPDLLQFARREGLRPTLKKWERKLKIIESVLNDAEEKQLTDSNVKMWLDDLQDLAYDVEDILDEFATEARRRKLVMPTHDHHHQGASSSTNKVRGVFTACCFNTSNWSPTAIKFNISMNSKINAITSRMEELYNQKSDFGLKEIGGKASSTSTAAVVRPPTTCLPTEFAVYGRDEEKAKVLEMVLSHEGPSDANFGVVPIVGMGGLGKTTLAREVYNDQAVNDFEPKAWVCVSDVFDVLGISKAILESITSKSCDLKDLNQVQLQLKDVLVGKKFLLVLDDVWSKDYNLWETLRSPFKVGAPGSKIIVTTRSAEVALTMGPGPVGYYNLKLLSDEDCWSVFKKHAFQNSDINAIRNLELIRDRVVQKCRGLPLAARTLGGLLCSKQGDDEWEDILNSAIWDLSDENGILPVLKLSYHHLPSHLKRCFAFCAIMPKDYDFNKKDLVLLWMAEGLIQKRNDNKQLEELGGRYFNELLSRSIFQQSVSNVSKFVMHDLINDLAQWASGKTSFSLEANDEKNKHMKMSEKARHFSFISTHYNDKAKFEVLRKVERLRTFLAITPSNNYYIFYISVMVLSDLLLKFKKLRALS
ncbi:hypothetical protein Dsin_028117 [Dipteronia sinensis]|uniref:Disease resistance RPP13-like protein 1 n=1 Tax=Dipteronia sinensis TaxID=43782 RepID=A0AAD9ZRM0_9ROSI|nr:hypothetical protein Dsin_028117 [Dipteronia sinensis]